MLVTLCRKLASIDRLISQTIKTSIYKTIINEAFEIYPIYRKNLRYRYRVLVGFGDNKEQQIGVNCGHVLQG